MQASYCLENNHNVDNNFCNAFDEFNDINRKLFEVPEIDKLLSFSDKKNICIRNQSRQSSNFLNRIIARICIDYHLCKTSDKDNKVEKKRTILIDAGSGNNLGSFYINLVNQAIKKETDLNSILDEIIIARAFTFSQLANMLIYELPKMVKIGNKLQIIVLDLFDTLVSSNVKSRMNKYENNDYSEKPRNAIQENINIINEMIDVLIGLSVKYFVILTCDDYENIKDNSIAFKFNNTINIKCSTDKNKNKNEQIFKIEQIVACHNNNSINIVNTKQLTYLDRDKVFPPTKLVNLSEA
ncbi:MAG: hypothetical protein P0116_09400 [Candidatus Nitrosocosmicus sp.]|nr:hypothetical protein [Candidatus Nitrosocosmicus sp.]